MNTLTLPEKNGTKRETKGHRCILGKAGEKTATRILSGAGLVICERNWRAGHIEELNLIAREGEKTVIVEVRTHIDQHLSMPLESVDRRKIAKPRRLVGR